MTEHMVRRTPRTQPPYRKDFEEIAYESDEPDGEKAVLRCVSDRYKKQQKDFPRFNPYYKLTPEAKRLGAVKMEVTEEGVLGPGPGEEEHQSRDKQNGSVEELVVVTEVGW